MTEHTPTRMKSDSAHEAEVAALRDILATVEAERDRMRGERNTYRASYHEYIGKCATAESIISSARAAPDAVEAAILAYLQPISSGGFSLDMQAALTAAGIHLDKVTPAEQVLMGQIDDLEAKVRHLKWMIATARIITIHPNDDGYAGEPNGQNAYEIEWPDVADFDTTLSAERERAEKAEGERDAARKESTDWAVGHYCVEAALKKADGELGKWRDALDRSDTAYQEAQGRLEIAEATLSAAQTRAWLAGRDAVIAVAGPWVERGLLRMLHALQPPEDFAAPVLPLPAEWARAWIEARDKARAIAHSYGAFNAADQISKMEPPAYFAAQIELNKAQQRYADIARTVGMQPCGVNDIAVAPVEHASKLEAKWPQIVYWNGALGTPNGLAGNLEQYAKIRPGGNRDIWAMKAAAKFIRAIVADCAPPTQDETLYPNLPITKDMMDRAVNAYHNSGVDKRHTYEPDRWRRTLEAAFHGTCSAEAAPVDGESK
jgi:uncharacterized protein YecT (DUF1311 family)